MSTWALAALVLWSGAAVLGSNAEAQDKKPPQESERKPSNADADEELAELQKAFDEAYAAWREAQAEAVQAAIEKGGAIPAMRMAPEPAFYAEHLQAFAAAARRHGDGEGAVGFHLWILRHGKSAEDARTTQSSMMAIYKHHLTSERMIELPQALRMAESLVPAGRVDQMLKQLEKVHRDPNVRANSMHVRLVPTIQNNPVESKEYLQAKRELETALAAVTDGELTARIRATFEEKEGKDGDQAKDIVGVDMDGVDFKLSDYKGKVILLDFWGDW